LTIIAALIKEVGKASSSFELNRVNAEVVGDAEGGDLFSVDVVGKSARDPHVPVIKVEERRALVEGVESELAVVAGSGGIGVRRRGKAEGEGAKSNGTSGE